MAKTRYPSEKLDQYMLRLPDGMRDRIKAAAAENNRSMNAEIVATLEEKYPVKSFKDMTRGELLDYIFDAESPLELAARLDKVNAELGDGAAGIDTRVNGEDVEIFVKVK